ncbi:MAG: sialidase family protein [bacterium]
MGHQQFKIPFFLCIFLLVLNTFSCEKPIGPADEQPAIHHEWTTVLNTRTWATSLIEVPSHPGTLLLTGTQVFLDSCIGGLYRSTDWGATWTELYDGIDFIGPSYVEGDPPRVYATMGVRFDDMLPVQSFDAGLTWSAITDTLPAIYNHESFLKIISKSDNPLDIILVSSFLPSDFGGRSWRSFNGGQSWTLINPYNLASVSLIVRNPFDPNSIAVSANGYFFHSYDNGLTWNQLFPFGTGLGKIQFMDEESQWIFTNNKDSMYETFNGGESFTPFGEELPEGSIFEDFVYDNGGIVAAVYVPSGDYFLYRMDLEERVWTEWYQIPILGSMRLVQAGDYLFIVVNDGMFHTVTVMRY